LADHVIVSKGEEVREVYVSETPEAIDNQELLANSSPRIGGTEPGAEIN